MSLRAKDLTRTAADSRVIEAAVREQLTVLDDKIKSHQGCWGRNVSAYNLPDTIAFPGVQKQDAQRVVYSRMIESLERRGFEVGLALEPSPKLYVAWTTQMDPQALDRMNTVLASHMLRDPGEVESFLRPAGQPAS